MLPDIISVSFFKKPNQCCSVFLSSAIICNIMTNATNSYIKLTKSAVRQTVLLKKEHWAANQQCMKAEMKGVKMNGSSCVCFTV